MGGSPDASGNPASAQLSLVKSLLIIGAAGTLGFPIGDPATPDKEDKPFGESQSRQERMQTQLTRAREPGRGRRGRANPKDYKVTVRASPRGLRLQPVLRAVSRLGGAAVADYAGSMRSPSVPGTRLS